MSIALNLMAARQNAASPTIVLWGGADPEVKEILLLVAKRRLAPEEFDPALEGTLAECVKAVVSTSAPAVRDDLSPAGEARYYGVVAVFADGTRKPLRFRAGPMSQPPEGTLDLSSLGVSAPDPSPAKSGVFRVPVQPRMAEASPPPAPEPLQVSAPAVEVDPRAARRAAQKKALEAVQASESAPRPPGAAPAESRAFPVARFGLRMVGATQSWDGLRVQWESEGRSAEAWEVVIADRPLTPEETGALLSGESLEGARVGVFAPEARALIDNVTPREARGQYAVIARSAGGDRHPVGCVVQGYDECRLASAPFFAPTELAEVTDLAKGLVREARVQLMIWQEEADVGAWREALRLVGDALVLYPGFEQALLCRREIEAARTL